MRARPSHWRRADLEAEEAVGHDGEEHDAAGEDDLDDATCGASARAATWRTKRRAATAMPIANHFGEKSALAAAQRVPDVDRGRGARAPVLVEKKPRFVANAQTSASRMPS